jgi:uracil-DNA glycosylase
MSTTREIKEIIEGIRLGLLAGREWGLEPPLLSPDALAFLEGRSSSRQAPVTPSRGGPPTLAQEGPSTLEQLREIIGDCRRCKLCTGRTNLVFGEGSPNAKLVFVGEGPGKDEDFEGRPFVGEAGKLLNKIIEGGFKMKREEVYICNVVKCRPPANRKPEADEIGSCLPFLREQLRIINPQVICGLGQVASSTLMGRTCKISQERGTWSSYKATPLMPTFHPAYILRNPADEQRLKRLVWGDVKKIMALMGLRNED